MNNLNLKSLKARYPELFPLNSSKEDFIKYLTYYKNIEDKRLIVTSNNIQYNPHMIAYLFKYLSKVDKYPTVTLLNAHEVSEIYITGSQDGTMLRLSDIQSDILFLTAGYNEPSNKSLKDCIGYLMNSYILKDKVLFIYLKGSSPLVRDIESLGKNLQLPFYNVNNITNPKKATKPSDKPSNSSQMSLF